MPEFGNGPELNRADVASVEAEMRSMHVVSQLLPTHPEKAPLSETSALALDANAQEFSDKFDDLVDILCGAAKEGVTDRRRKRYSEIRNWFQIRELSLERLLRKHQVEGYDADSNACIHSLFQPEQIEGVIHSESVILRMMHTRALVDGCRQMDESIKV